MGVTQNMSGLSDVVISVMAEACKAVGLARSTYRRLPLAQTPADPDAEVRA